MGGGCQAAGGSGPCTPLGQQSGRGSPSPVTYRAHTGHLLVKQGVPAWELGASQRGRTLTTGENWANQITPVLPGDVMKNTEITPITIPYVFNRNISSTKVRTLLGGVFQLWKDMTGSLLRASGRNLEWDLGMAFSSTNQ